MVEPTPELAPDLEWMLLSRQASQGMIVEALVEGYYDPLYRLALSLLEDSKDARQAVLQTMIEVVCRAHRYQGGCGVQVWLFQNALRVCRQMRRTPGRTVAIPCGRVFGTPHPLKRIPNPVNLADPLTEAEAGLWQALDALPEGEALPLRLYAAFGLAVPEIAQALHLKEGMARRRLEAGWKKIEPGLAGAGLSRVEQEQFLGESLQRRWPAYARTQEQDEHLQQEVEGQLLSPETKHPWARPAKRLAWQASILLLIAAVAWLSYRAAPADSGGLPPARMRTATKIVQVRQVPPFPDEPKVDGWPSRQAFAAGETAWRALGGIPARLILDLPLSFVDLTTANPPDDLNNSGAIELSRVLKYWGQPVDLTRLTRDLQPSPSDPNVMPYELDQYVRENTKLRSILRLGGDYALLARFINAGFPVILEKGFEWDSYIGWVGHYVIAKGYDQDKAGAITLSSSLAFDPTPVLDTGQLQEEWRDFNYLYLVVYPPEKETEVMKILGPQADLGYNYRYAAAVAAREAAHLSGKDLFFALFNRGASLTYLHDYQGAAQAFDQAFKVYVEIISPSETRPWRLLWYSSRPYQAYYQAGRYRDVIRLADQTLSSAAASGLEESFYWRGLARKALGDPAGATADLEKALEINPNFKAGAFQLSQMPGSSSGGRSYATR